MAQTFLQGHAEAAPPQPETKTEAPRYQYRWQENGAEFGVDLAGHTRVVRCGDLVAGTRVRLRLPGLTHRRGTVVGLMPGLGRPLRVVVYVELDPPRRSRPDPSAAPPVAPVKPFRPAELLVIL
jgi:hypothetical protein